MKLIIWTYEHQDIPSAQRRKPILKRGWDWSVLPHFAWATLSNKQSTTNKNYESKTHTNTTTGKVRIPKKQHPKSIQPSNKREQSQKRLCRSWFEWRWQRRFFMKYWEHFLLHLHLFCNTQKIMKNKNIYCPQEWYCILFSVHKNNSYKTNKMPCARTFQTNEDWPIDTLS